MESECAICHFNLGYVYHEDGQYESAQICYEKAIELDPTCSLYLENCARLHFEMLDYKETTRLYYRASLVGKIQAVSLGLWGRALFEQGLYEQSIETFERLMEHEQPQLIQDGAKYWLALARVKLGHIASARRITKELLSSKAIEPKILFELAENFVEARCLSLAKEIFEKIAGDKDDILIAKLRIDDIQSIEKQIDEMLPRIFEGDEERTLHQIHALGEFGNDKISRALLSLLSSHSAPLREAIIRYQTKYGYEIPDFIRPLLKDPVPFVREAAFDYFENLFLNVYLDDILFGLKDPYFEIRRRAARILGRYGTFEHVPDLEIALDDPSSKDCSGEIRQAIGLIKFRYQRKIDEMYQQKTPIYFPMQPRYRRSIWRVWFLILFQIFAVTYFIYWILRW